MPVVGCYTVDVVTWWTWWWLSCTLKCLIVDRVVIMWDNIVLRSHSLLLQAAACRCTFANIWVFCKHFSGLPMLPRAFRCWGQQICGEAAEICRIPQHFFKIIIPTSHLKPHHWFWSKHQTYLSSYESLNLIWLISSSNFFFYIFN